MAGEHLLEWHEVTKRFGTRLVLDRVSLSIRTGETVALIGPSGGGKSTFLRCANGLSSFESGKVCVGDHELAAPVSEGPTVRSVRRLVGMVFQDYQLFPHLTALENIVLAPCRVLGTPRQVAQERGRELLTRVGLGDRGGAFPRQLSGGQKQRVAIARALAMQPRALLCDEITAALDPELKHEVLEVLADLKRDGMTLVLVTHEIGFARRAADRVVVLADGKLIEEGPPGDVLDNPKHPRTRQFLERTLN